MRSKIKHIIRVILIFALIVCWGTSIGYTNNIKPDKKVINFYFENGLITSNKLEEIKNDNMELSTVGWKEEQLQTVVNPDLNRKANNLKILFTKGNTALLIDSATLFDDDVAGCLIDDDTAYRLFGSNNVVGKQIQYGERVLTVMGIHSGTKANVVMKVDEEEEIVLDGLAIDGTDLSMTKIREFRSQYGIKELDIDGGIYYYIAKVMALLLPMVAMILILVKIIKDSVKVRKKPVFLLIYVLVGIGIVFAFFRITSIKIDIPLDMIPNKWSDFDFWSKLWKEYKEKFEYVLYMKKYGVDIYNIENLIRCILYTIMTIVLFIINLKFIKITNAKELVVNIFTIIVCVFISVLTIYFNFGFDVNIAMFWIVYPLYLVAIYSIDYLKILEK